jgi:hypothetical protein
MREVSRRRPTAIREGSTVSTATEERATLTESLETRIHEAIDEFQQMELSQMRKGEIEARAKLADAKRKVRERQAVATARLHNAKKASASAWEEARSGLEEAWEDLRAAVHAARRSFDGIPEEDGEASESDV